MPNQQTAHKEGVERLAKEVCRHYGVWPLIEPKAPGVRDIPDVFAVLKDGRSLAFDWKESEQDMHSHIQKPQVRDPRAHVGTHCYIASAPGVLDFREFDWWPYWLGHVVVTNSGISEVKPCKPLLDVHHEAERLILWSAIRNLSREAGKSADEARPSAGQKLSKHQEQVMANAVTHHRCMTLHDIAKDLKGAFGLKDSLQALRKKAANSAANMPELTVRTNGKTYVEPAEQKESV